VIGEVMRHEVLEGGGKLYSDGTAWTGRKEGKYVCLEGSAVGLGDRKVVWAGIWREDV